VIERSAAELALWDRSRRSGRNWMVAARSAWPFGGVMVRLNEHFRQGNSIQSLSGFSSPRSKNAAPACVASAACLAFLCPVTCSEESGSGCSPWRFVPQPAGP
jgi:hypothetical protein